MPGIKPVLYPSRRSSGARIANIVSLKVLCMNIIFAINTKGYKANQMIGSALMEKKAKQK